MARGLRLRYRDDVTDNFSERNGNGLKRVRIEMHAINTARTNNLI